MDIDGHNRVGHVHIDGKLRTPVAYHHHYRSSWSQGPCVKRRRCSRKKTRKSSAKHVETLKYWNVSAGRPTHHTHVPNQSIQRICWRPQHYLMALFEASCMHKLARNCMQSHTLERKSVQDARKDHAFAHVHSSCTLQPSCSNTIFRLRVIRAEKNRFGTRYLCSDDVRHELQRRSLIKIARNKYKPAETYWSRRKPMYMVRYANDGVPKIWYCHVSFALFVSIVVYFPYRITRKNVAVQWGR